jgi:membrane-associated protease RseP (regulator of RpoE activity)
MEETVMTWKPTYLALAALAALAVALPGTANAADPAPEKSTMKKTVVYVSEDKPREGKSPYLGVSLGEETESPDGGARIEDVFDDSPAAKAGLREGDVIVQFGATAIHGPMALTKKIHESKAGDKVPVTVLRDGKQETLTVEIGERAERRIVVKVPDFEGEDLIVPMPDLDKLKIELHDLDGQKDVLEKQADAMKRIHVLGRGRGRGLSWFAAEYGKPRLGVELVEATPDLREFLGGKRDAGVLVGKILAGRPAERAGIRVGDLIVSVDGTSVEDSGDLIDTLSEKDGKTVDLEIVRDKRTMHLKVEIPKVEDDEPGGPRAELQAPAPPAPPSPPSPPECPLPPRADRIPI